MFHTSLSPFNHKDARIFLKKQDQSGHCYFDFRRIKFLSFYNGHSPHFQHSIAAGVANRFPSQPDHYGPPALLGQLSGGICSYTHIPHYPHNGPPVPQFDFDLLFISGMPLFECVACFPHILPSTPPASSQINYKRTIAV